MKKLFVLFCLGLLFVPFVFAQERPNVVFVTGDDEYRSEITMPMIARILEQRHDFDTEVVYAVNPRTGERDPKYQLNIEGLEALQNADLAVFYIRFRALPKEQITWILNYVNSGKPIVGLRTSTHSFLYKGGPYQKWNDQFGIDIFGQKWITHHGHQSTTEVMINDENAGHPILNGVQDEYHGDSWLYHVEPIAGDYTPLLMGKAIDSNKEGQLDQYPLVQPVAWTKHYESDTGKARVFFTTLGHPGDFEKESMRKLLINGIYWALSMEGQIPPEGSNAVPVQPYDAPPTH